MYDLESDRIYPPAVKFMSIKINLLDIIINLYEWFYNIITYKLYKCNICYKCILLS